MEGLKNINVKLGDKECELVNREVGNMLLEFCYPIGSLYWSSKSTNPGTLFGGTWVQIKDRFVLAAGDKYPTSGATGGADSADDYGKIKLTVSNLPSHDHTFTPSGSVSSTFTGTSVKTNSTGSHSHTTNSLRNSSDIDISNTGGMSERSSGSFTVAGRGGDNWDGYNGDAPRPHELCYVDGTVFTKEITYGNTRQLERGSYTSSDGIKRYIMNISHVHDFQHKHTTDSQGDHSHSVTATGSVSSSFSGKAGTTDPTGSSTSFSILPPYVVKYCFERTA